ncbi:uncharacterized protein Nlg1 [Calliphora vicina]|uniref:uncharacterized protein Nlg1 n=1 Tax=Calliphora vicina TaxID=7373 RepID=UPI00325BFD48
MKHSTIFWIYWLTFVSIHHNQLQCTSAVVVKQQQLQLQPFQQLHKTAALSTSALIKRRQHQQQQQQKQQQWFPQGTTKEVIGDVVDLPLDIDVPKENHEKNVEKNNLAKALNVKQKKNAIKTLQQAAAAKAKTATTSTSTTTSPTTATSTKLFMQQLLKQHEETLQKLNDTGGSQAGGLTNVDDADEDDDDDSFEIHSAEMKTLPNIPITKQYQSRSDNNTKDSLLFGFKENLQNLLKSNISQIKLQPEFNEEYVSTATSSTIKRAAIMLQPQSTTTAAMTPTTPASTMPSTSDAAAAPTPTTNRQYNMFYAHSTPVERRHIIPEKLQYTRELYIKQGRLMGIKRNFQPSSGLRAVDQYLGLPYAEAPVGSRRFMPPGAALPWQGLKMAHHLPPVCPQKLPDISLQGTAKMSKGRYKHLTRLLPYLKTESEDCLYLNVYVPSDNDATSTDKDGGGPAFAYASAAAASRDDSFMQKHLYPVVVYIHGESFEWNSGNAYDGSVLASNGEVIVVTVNYRLGILGFMRPSINENTVANFGLLDQIAALHWIKENIHSFGGDKDSVTLMGHTTGAACINYLMVSPVASGLFHRAILMSGSAMSDWAATNHSLQLTMQIAHGLNCPLNDDNEEMLSCLRQKRYQDILKIRTTLSQFSTSLGPIVDGHVIPNQPYKVMGQYTEHFSRYDLLFGITESESYHSLGALALEEGLRENERDNLLRFYMQSRFDVRPDLALAATLKKYSEMYNNPIKATNMEHRDVVLDILSDARVVGPLMQTGLFHADVNRHNYMYVFGHNSFGGPHASLPHSIAGEELAFVFGAPLASAGLFHGTQYTAQEKLLAEAVMSYWCNFAKTGNPKAPWKGNFINLHALEWDRYDLEWPEFNKRSQAYMNIGIPPSVGYKYRQVYMNFWNKELPDELNQIAHIQQQPFLQTNNYNGNSNSNNNNNYDNGNAAGGSTAIYPKRYGAKLDVITGHMNKFGARDNGAEDPLRTIKLLLQEPYSNGKETQAENMYNAPPSTQYKGMVMSTGNVPGSNDDNDDDDDEVKAQGYEIRYNGYATKTTRSPYAAIYGSRQFDTHFGSGNSGIAKTQGVGYDKKYFDSSSSSKTNNGNYVNEDNKPSGDEADNSEHVAKSETTLHLLIGLIIVFIILNVIIYSTFLMQKKKKTKTLQRKLGGGILTYDGTTDDDLKRSKTNTTHQGDDGDDSFIMDTMRKSNTYEQVKTERSPINGFQITRQLSCSTVDTHTKVSEWITTTEPHKQATLQRRLSSGRNSKKSSSFSSSLRGSGSFGKPQPCKVSVAIDATPEGRGSGISEQEPIEITKMKQDGRNIIICQDIEVDDQELLTPQDSLDNSRYTLMRQHSAVTEACEAELIQPMHQHSRSDPVEMYYNQNEKITSFIANEDNDMQDINVTSKDEDYDVPQEALTAEQQLNVIKRRKYPKVLPTFMQYERETDSPPMTKDLSTTYKRNSMPPNAYFPHFAHIKQQPPLPPPRTIATLGRKPSIGRRNSNNITTSPLMLAHDYAEEEEEEPEITQNTLIVGSLKPTEGYYSTLRRHNKPANLDTQTPNYHIPSQQQTATAAAAIASSAPLPINQQQSVFQSFESQPPSYKTPERDVTAHLTEKVYCIQATPANDKHQPSCSNSEPTTPQYYATPTAMINDSYAAAALPPGIVYAQPKKSHIPRILANNAATPAAASSSNASLIHSSINENHVGVYSQASSSDAVAYNCKDTTNCCQVVPKVPNDNQMSSGETLQTPDINTTVAGTMLQTRIPQLHRNANPATIQQQQQQNINIDKTNANIIPKATIKTPNILTAATATATANKQTLPLTPNTATTTTELSSTKVLSSALSSPAAATTLSTSLAASSSSCAKTTTLTTPSLTSSAFGNCKSYDVATPKTCSNKTSSITSSSSLSSSSSLQSDSGSSSSATSSSTGTVRTELQHK